MALRSKLALGFIVYSMTIATVLVALSGFWVLREFKAPGAHSQPVTINIPTGSSSGAIAQQLLDINAFDRERDILIFKLALKAQDSASDLKAGEYEIPPRASIQRIVAQLKQGKVVQRQVTVREGLTSYEVVLLLNEQEELFNFLVCEGTGRLIEYHDTSIFR